MSFDVVVVGSANLDLVATTIPGVPTAASVPTLAPVSVNTDSAGFIVIRSVWTGNPVPFTRSAVPFNFTSLVLAITSRTVLLAVANTPTSINN